MNLAIRKWIEANKQPWRASPEKSIFWGLLGTNGTLPLDPETEAYFVRRGIETDGRLIEDLLEADLLDVVKTISSWLEPEERKRFDEGVAFGFGSTLEPNACAMECLDGYAILFDDSFHALLVHALELYYSRMGSGRTIKPKEFPLILNSAMATMFFHGADPIEYMALKPRVTPIQRELTNRALWLTSAFFLGHEAGHILLNHFEEAPERQEMFRNRAGLETVEVLQPTHSDEFAADRYASDLLFVGEEHGELMKADLPRVQYWNSCYGMLGWVFSVLGAVERMSARIGFALGDTHPPASKRWEKIAGSLRTRAPIHDLMIRVDEKLRGIALEAAESGPMPLISEQMLHAKEGFVGLPWSTVQQIHKVDKEAEQLPAREVVEAWLYSPTPSAAMQVLLGFPEMLNPRVEAMHYEWANSEPDESVRRDILVNKLLILCRCKEIGIEAAFDEFEAKKLGLRTKPPPSYDASESVELPVLSKVEEALKKFVNADTAAETEAIYESHPELQHPSADLFLVEFAAEQPNESARKRVEAARIILAYSKKFTVFRAVLEARARLRY
jgi:hypothetical protein